MSHETSLPKDRARKTANLCRSILQLLLRCSATVLPQSSWGNGNNAEKISEAPVTQTMRPIHWCCLSSLV